MSLGKLRPAYPGGFAAATTDPTSQAAARGSAQGFYITSAGNAWVAVRNAATPVALSIANATPIGTGVYGPFYFGADDSHVHVAGRGATPVVIVTLV